MKNDPVPKLLPLVMCICAMAFLLNCDSANPVSPGPQPSYLQRIKHRAGLNVFGILRPDSSDGLPLSYVHVEFSYPADEMPDSTIVSDAQVRIKKSNGTAVTDSCDLVYSDFEIFPTREFRDRSFFPMQGTYQLICRKEGFPVLTAETTMPSVPVIQSGIIHQFKNVLSFSICRDENVGLYEVVLQGQGWLIRDRFLRPSSGDVPVSLPLHGVPPGASLLVVYAFDINMSEYLTVNMSLKPNIYQKDFSTVQNGYGCFGSLNIYSQSVDIVSTKD
jgi:hypothetical protein